MRCPIRQEWDVETIQNHKAKVSLSGTQRPSCESFRGRIYDLLLLTKNSSPDDELRSTKHHELVEERFGVRSTGCYPFLWDLGWANNCSRTQRGLINSTFDDGCCPPTHSIPEAHTSMHHHALSPTPDPPPSLHGKTRRLWQDACRNAFVQCWSCHFNLVDLCSAYFSGFLRRLTLRCRAQSPRDATPAITRVHMGRICQYAHVDTNFRPCNHCIQTVVGRLRWVCIAFTLGGKRGGGTPYIQSSVLDLALSSTLATQIRCNAFNQ
jgi:hypothetical protein